MYRTSAHPDPSSPIDHQVTIEVFDRNRNHFSGVAALQLFAIPVVIGIVVSFVSARAALPSIVATAIALVVVWRTRRKPDLLVLSVEKEKLSIYAKKREILNVPLSRIRDVELDTKTISRFMEGDSAIPGLRILNGTSGPEVDTARVTIVTKEKRFVLNQNYIAHMDASEVFRKVRLFLRRHQWLPKDERAPKAPS